MVALPRSALLAAWGTAVLAGTADPLAAVRAITGDDEPHAVGLPAGAVPPPAVPGPVPATGLVDLFAGLVRQGARGLRVVLPAPGDVLGLPGPPAFNEAALEAGECVLVEPGDDGGPAGTVWGAVPEITSFGSAWEPGALVTWHVHDVTPPRVTVTGGIAEADRELRTALDTATRELARLDVARWRDDAADRLAAIRETAVDRGLLPPDLPPRCLRVLLTAARVRAIVDLASGDDGGALNSYEAGTRAETLRGLDRVSRRAVVAAVNGLLEPAP